MHILKPHIEKLQPNWLDSYGHLNEAYYIVAFSNATWPLQNYFGIGDIYFTSTGNALYTLESHIRYIKEVRGPATLTIHSSILGLRQKKLWIAHQMEVNQKLRATFECLLLHYDTRNECAIPFTTQTLIRLEAEKVEKLPTWVGKSIKLYSHKK